jgi:hypothetical protein
LNLWPPAPTFVTRKVSDGLVASQCFNVAVSQQGPLVVGCSTYHTGILRSGRDHFETWEHIDGPEGGLFEIDPTDGNKMFCGPWQQGNLHVSKNGGSSFDNRQLTFTDSTGDKAAYPVALGLRPDDGNRLYAGAFFGWLYYSLDGGDHWDHVQDAAGSALLPAGGTDRADRVIGFGFAPSNPAVLYIGTTNRRLWRTTTGATASSGWSELSQPSPGTSDPIGAIAVHPTDPNTVYIGYGNNASGRVWRGTQQANGTFAWTGLGAALPSAAVSALVIDPLHPTHVFAATNLGVFATADAGATWHPFGAGLPNTRVVGLRLRRLDHTLWAAAVGRGIFYWHLA